MPSYLGVNVLCSGVHDHDDARAVCVAVPELVIPASQKAMRW